MMGREGGGGLVGVGRRSLGSPGRAAIFARGKETGLRGSNFEKSPMTRALF